MPVEENVPWQAVVGDTSAPPKFDEVCFDSFELPKSLPRREILEKWFQPVAGQAPVISEARTTVGQCSAIDGTFRLKAPLAPDRALRVWMESYHRLQIHLWQGNSGVMLVYHEDDSWRWSAYQVEREAGAIVPRRSRLVATDDGRARRTNIRHGGPLELRVDAWRHRAGAGPLTGGDHRSALLR